ncbi:MARH5 ligase, partial [Polyodon spathula]|nr:MARH5 ligase [Polyodon spathula]
KLIIKNRSCKPKESFPPDNKNRCFSSGYYYKVTKNGDKVPRKWLEYRDQVSCWIAVSQRVIDITLTLATCSLAFRGHREKLAKSSGNLETLSVIEVLSKYDPVLKQLIEKINKYKMEELLRYEAQFYSVITKSFLGFHNITDQSAQGLEIEIVKMIKDKGLSIKKCSLKTDECSETAGLKKRMDTFEFVLMVVIQSKVLETVNIVSKLPQSKDMDLFLATKMLNSATETFTSFRKQFGETKATASSLASSWGILFLSSLCSPSLYDPWSPPWSNCSRSCWVCFATDEDDRTAEWVRPCRCRGSTKWVHQACLQRWVDEKQRGNSTARVACPQCNAEYLIMFPKLDQTSPHDGHEHEMDLTNQQGCNMF